MSTSKWICLACVSAGCMPIDDRVFDSPQQDTLETLPVGGGSAGTGQSTKPDADLAAPAVGEVRAHPTSIDFGLVTLGVEAKASLRLTNEGPALERVPRARIEGATGGDFVLAQNLCVSALENGVGCDIALALRATEPGPLAATLLIDTDGGAPLVVPLSGTALRKANISITPLGGGTTDFGASGIDQTREQRLRLVNDGNEPSGVLELSIAGDDFTLVAPAGVTDCVSGSTSLGAAQSCDVLVVFRPLERGDRFATLTVRAGTDAGASLGLTGKGLAPALLAASPLELDYGPVVREGVAERFISISNLGDEPSGALLFAKSGASADSLSWDVAGCSGALAPSGSCSLLLTFSPAAEGPHSATLSLSAEPGGSVDVSVNGTGLLPGAVSLAAEASGSPDFEGVLQNTFLEQTFVVTNTGGLPSGPITVTVQGLGFTSISGGSCQDGFTDLAGGSSCTTRVRFAPGALRGPVSGTLSVASTGAGGDSLTLSGQALAPAALVSQAGTQRDFGFAEAGQVGNSFEWVVTNTGDIAAEAPVFSSTGEDFRVTNRCVGSIAPGGSCSVTLAFAPRSLGTKTGSVSLLGGDGLGSTFSMTGSGQVRLTVQLAGNGSGQITSQPAGLDCTATAGCSGLFSSPGVIVAARTTNGTDSLFGGWSETTCAGPLRSCSLTLASSRTLTATFNRVTQNVAFLSSRGIAANLGSLTTYDAHCNTAASDAGINNAAGTGYTAAMSSNTAAFSTRFPANVQGWVRMDGRPFISSFADAFQRRVIHYPVAFDENGLIRGEFYMTGTGLDGAPSLNCENWTSNVEATIDISIYPTIGDPLGGPDAWMNAAVGRCHIPNNILCLGRTKTVALSVPRTAGRRIWVSTNHYVPGTGTPDAHCQADRPAGVVNASALVATTSRTAASLLDPAANYVRVDGVLVGTGAELIAKQPLTGIWVSSAGQSQESYLSRVWGGPDGPNAMNETGTQANTCNNWTSTADTVEAGVGFYNTAADRFWSSGPFPCSIARDAFVDIIPHLYCVER